MSFFKNFSKLASKSSVRPVARPVRLAGGTQTLGPQVKVQPVPQPQPQVLAAAKAQAEAQAREIILEAKDQAVELKRQSQADIDRRELLLTQREDGLQKRQQQLESEAKEIETVKQKQLEKLQTISKMDAAKARELILTMYQKRMTHETADIIREAEEKAKAEAEEKAKEILVEAMRHGATDYVPEYTVSLVKVTDEDVKGRIIGREGRNIRTFEKVTGVEVDLDEPGVIRLSSFDPVRREIAKVSLEKLLADGRVQPVRIEELVAQVKRDIDRIIRQEGERLCHTVKVFNLPVEIIDKLGRFKYRFSYGQNMIAHTLEETKIGIKLAHEVGADVNIVRLGCLLHDIGKVIQDEDGTHVELGVKFLTRFRVPQAVIDCVAEHHEDKPFSSVESMLVYISDAISGSRPGARYEDHEGYLKRMTQIEDIAKSFAGVKEVYALQAGREVRVGVDPAELNDDASVKLASDIRDKIKDTIKDFPGQIKISVFRELRVEATT